MSKQGDAISVLLDDMRSELDRMSDKLETVADAIDDMRNALPLADYVDSDVTRHRAASDLLMRQTMWMNAVWGSCPVYVVGHD